MGDDDTVSGRTEYSAGALSETESEYRLRTVLENSPVVLVAFDASGTITQAEGRDLSTFVAPELLLGLPLAQLANAVPPAAAAVASGLAGESGDVVATFRGNHFDFRFHPTWDDAGRVIGVLAVASNITSDVEAVQERGEREARWESLVSQSADVALIADATTTALTYVSSAVTRLFGWQPDELIGRVGTSLVHPDDLARVTEALLALGDDSSTHVTIEFRFACADGSYRWVEETISNLADVPGVHGLVGNMRDITDRKSATEALRHRDGLTRALAAKAADVALVVGLDGRVRYSNPSASLISVADEGDSLDLENLSYVHPDDRAAVRETFGGLRTPNASMRMKYRRLGADGSWRWVEHIATNCLGDPDIQGLVVNLREITEQVEAEEALRESEGRYRLIAETAQEGIWATNMDGQTLFANQKMADLLGRSITDFYEKPSWELITGKTDADYRHRLLRPEEFGAERYDLDHIRPDGSARILQLSVSPFVDHGQRLGSLSMVSDITEMRATEEKLRYRAFHDPLTGLANRALLVERLEEALGRTPGADKLSHAVASVAVLVADIDQFKLVNDSFGHASGDDLLTHVAQRWRGALDERHTLARVGGDEFVVVCEACDEHGARAIAGNLVAALQDPISLQGRPVAVSASIGIAVATSPSNESADTLLAYADAAMYEAKGKGRGRVALFTPCLAEQARNRLELFNELKGALEREELELRYQPVIELASGRLIGVEALCRWTHAERGVIAPDEFIPLAEETGLIEPLDRWVLRRACRDGAAMRSAGVLPAHAYIAVNASAGHLAQPGFEHAVRAALDDSGLPAQSLVLEVTESAAMRDPDATQIVLESLRELGVEVAIDDFGTGYSSLAYLRRFPVSTLKIDRSFIQHVTENSDDQAIVTALIDLASALKVTTVAEGVETTADLGLLQRLGCYAGQGFLWSPAVRPGELAVLLARLPDGRFPVEPPVRIRRILPPPRSPSALRTG